eukprot:snap_masked-scaffold_38-processed-gene-1.50-mRNA-1 protein AED:1.00 eAED:1.00 QI:0/-1/0/0/-1/1/1/0/455
MKPSPRLPERPSDSFFASKESDSLSVESNNEIPFLEIETMQRKYTAGSNGRKTMATFSPLAFLKNTEKDEIEIPDNKGAHHSLVSFVPMNMRTGTGQGQNMKGRILLLFILLTLGVASYLIYYFMEEAEDKDVVTEEVPTCSAADAEASRRLIGQNAFGENGTVVLKNIELTCFPQQPFTRTILSSVSHDRIQFLNVSINLIEQDVFGSGLGINLGGLDIKESKINTFLSQNQNIQALSIENSFISEYPSFFPAEFFILSQARDFKFGSNEVNLVASSPKSLIVLTSVLDTQSLVDFRDNLIAENKKVVLRGLTGFVPQLIIVGNFIRNIPSGFFGSDIMDIQAEEVVVELSGDGLLENIEEGAFQGNEHVGFQLSFSLCTFLQELPAEIKNVNLTSLSVESTAISSFDGFNFSQFNSLREINVASTAMASECVDLRSFKSKYGILDEVDVLGCE